GRPGPGARHPAGWVGGRRPVARCSGHRPTDRPVRDARLGCGPGPLLQRGRAVRGSGRQPDRDPARPVARWRDLPALRTDRRHRISDSPGQGLTDVRAVLPEIRPRGRTWPRPPRPSAPSRLIRPRRRSRPPPRRPMRLQMQPGSPRRPPSRSCPRRARRLPPLSQPWPLLRPTASVFLPDRLPDLPRERLVVLAVAFIGLGMALDRTGFDPRGWETTFLIGMLAVAGGALLGEPDRGRPTPPPARPPS